MNVMYSGNGPMRSEEQKKRTVPPPKGLRDLPRFLGELLGGFFQRLFYIFGIVWRTSPWILIAMSLIAIFEGVVPVIGSLISRNIVNRLQEESGSLASDDIAEFLGGAVFSLLVVLFTYRIIRNIVSRVHTALTRIAGEKVTRTVKLQIMEKSKTLDLASFDLPEFYEKLENANREAGNRPISVLSSLLSAISTVISLVSYVIVLVTVPGLWWIPLAEVAIAIPSAIVHFVYRRKHYRYIRYRSKDRRQMSYFSNQMASHEKAKEVRLFDLSDTFIERYDNVFTHYYHGLRRLILHESYLLVAIAAFSSVVSCCFYAMFAFGVLCGKFLIGDYTLYTNALTTISTNISTLINSSATIYEGTLFIDNLIDFMNEESKIVARIDPPEHVSRGGAHTIVFENVSFSYPGSDKRVLSDLSFTIRPGETLVLVGLNGAGKTTLIKLLTRLYDPTEGRILLDGKDLRDYDVKELYRIFGIIFQDFGKYAVTVRENIHFGDIHREINEDEIRAAAEQSAANEYIDALPEGYDTPLMRIFEENGTELSGGQWQKLAIARAFYSESDILILDEPTAALDPIAEQEIYKQFDALRADKTTVFVSHRLSSATVASKILVLEYGKLIEEGTHRELMEKEGRYYELFTTQAERYLEETDGASAKNQRRRRPMRPEA